MLRRTLVAFLVLQLVACGGSDDGDSKTCPDLDVGGPTFAPATAKSGEQVVATFPVEPASPGGSCPIEITLTCGAKKTTYTVNVNSKGETAPFALDCSGEAAAVKCSVQYDYQTPNSLTAGSADGPTCEP